MSIAGELFKIANQLDKYDNYDSSKLDALEKAAKTIGKAWSGSSLGYHSRVYYADFHRPPPGATFNPEWGFTFQDRPGVGPLGMDTRGDWREYDFDHVVQFIYRQAGNSSTDWWVADYQEAKETFEKAQQSVLSLVHANYTLENDKFLHGLVTNIESSKIALNSSSIEALMPQGQMVTRDPRALAEGHKNPPHIEILVHAIAVKQSIQSCKDLKKQIVSLVDHIQNLEKSTVQENRIGNKIFIGHGRSLHWREFKDFISDRLGLHWDEFNRVPVAGIPNTIRLAQMLDEAGMAFLVMTAEDEDAEGKLHARENVIHEAGLFQGRLGFERAIILLEEGCQEFSNIEGLGQIRFPKEDISAVFEEVRQVLEREGIIES